MTFGEMLTFPREKIYGKMNFIRRRGASWELTDVDKDRTLYKLRCFRARNNRMHF